MKALIEQYGEVILTVGVIVALIGVCMALGGTGGPLHQAFVSAINKMFETGGIDVTIPIS